MFALRRQSQEFVSSRPAWATQQVPAHPELHSEMYKEERKGSREGDILDALCSAENISFKRKLWGQQRCLKEYSTLGCDDDLLAIPMTPLITGTA